MPTHSRPMIFLTKANMLIKIFRTRSHTHRLPSRSCCQI